MLLRRLLHALPSARLAGDDGVEILDIAYDSRQVAPGCLFVAVPSVGGDSRSGGFMHIATAAARGAAAILCASPPEVALQIPYALVDDPRAALAEVATEFFGHPSREMRLFAVTGTDGKTTTTYLLDGVLSAAGFRTGLIGTVELKIGDERQFNADRMTTPESLDLQRLLRRMADSGVTHVSLEASSHALSLQRLRGTSFAACALTNVTADHLEFHGSWDTYFAAKATLFTDLGRGRPAILNIDDEHYGRLAAAVAGPVVSYGLSRDADIRADHLDLDRGSTHCSISAYGESAVTTVPLPGAFNVSNALAVTGLALAAGLALPVIARGLTSAQPPPGRMQRLNAGQDFEVLVDYAHTPHAFRSVLSSVREGASKRGRVIAVFGAAGNRDRAKRPLLAAIARRYADFFIITNEDPFGEQPDDIIAEVASGTDPGEEGNRFVREPDRTRAIFSAMEMAEPGDTVVILGKGHEQSIVVNGYKEPWSDIQVARDAVKALR